MAHPLRIQRKRTKGYRLPEGAVCVSRPSKWGNPFATASEFAEALARGDLGYDCHAVRRELRGKQLACWCPLASECHADVLASVANEEWYA